MQAATRPLRRLTPRAPRAMLVRAFSAKPAEKPLFEKILVANRGEIACRIFRTARKMGIRTVAIYSEADATAEHVLQADEAYCVGPPPSTESYLKMENILEVCVKHKVSAVHPGYGFLSERSAFCELLEKNGVVFIGPKAKSTSRMGLKIEAKKIAQAANVSLVPGFIGSVPNAEEAVKVARKIGYPVMIKASAGGGGKGMRVAYNDEEAIDGFRFSLAEAQKSFASDTMFVEKFIENPRHIEIQVLLDRYGNGVYLNERECSIQRRNQKVIEEAPSSFISPETRKAMGEQALRMAKAVEYESAGTCEFLVDKNQNFFFLEMNTRLQVEHPVTEFITGYDLVEQMIRIAAGQKLSIVQSDVKINGWALEARVYAEDPYRNFLPSIGRLTKYVEPPKTMPSESGKLDCTVRCDTGIVEGSHIQVYYDPLICKVIAHGPSRKDAIQTMRHALDSFVIRGVTHNVSFLRALLDHPRFIKGDTTTKFIPDEWPDGFKGTILKHSDRIALLATVYHVHVSTLRTKLSISGQLDSFNAEAEIEKNSAKVVAEVDGKTFTIARRPVPENDRIQAMVDESDGSYEVLEVVSEEHPEGQLVRSFASEEEIPGVLSAFVDGNDYTMQLITTAPHKYTMQYKGSHFTVSMMTPRQAELNALMPVPPKIDTSKLVQSPMPGLVVSIAVKPGDKVVAGQEVCVVEAMKMQNALRSAVDGVVKTIKVRVGENVAADQLLVEYE